VRFLMLPCHSHRFYQLLGISRRQWGIAQEVRAHPNNQRLGGQGARGIWIALAEELGEHT
jgi:hypothetical protein